MNRLQRWIGLGVVVSATACVGGSKEIGATVGGTEGSSGTDSAESSGSASITGVSMSSTTQGESTGATDTDPSGMTDPTTDPSTDPSGVTCATDCDSTDSTGGLPGSCDEAQDENTCNAIDTETLTCGWVPTIVVASGNGCEPVETGFEGECVLTEQGDSCTEPASPTCPDAETRVYYNLLGLEIGAIELVAFDSSFGCEESSMGFEPCVMIDGDPVTWDPPECGCLCPG